MGRGDAEIEFSSPEASALRDALSIARVRSGSIRPNLRAAAEGAGFATILQSSRLWPRNASHWYIKAEPAEADAEEVLKQALTAHRARALHRELQLAELV